MASVHPHPDMRWVATITRSFGEGVGAYETAEVVATFADRQDAILFVHAYNSRKPVSNWYIAELRELQYRD